MKNIHQIKIVNNKVSELDSTQPPQTQISEGVCWVHCEGDLSDIRSYLLNEFELPSIAVSALCDEYTRPRNLADEDDNLLVTLRTVVIDEVDGTHLASLRCWVSESLIISVAKDPLPAVAEVLSKYQTKVRGIQLGHHILWDLGRVIVEHITNFITSIDDSLDKLEDQWDDSHDIDADKLHQLRLAVSHARRYLSPQLDAFLKVGGSIYEHHSEKQEKQLFHTRWKELANSLKRDMETTTEMRERIVILKDALQQKTTEKTNKIMFLLSVVATFFLPLTFIASLMGMNLKGMPGEDSDIGFWLISGIMILVALVQWFLFKKWKWLH